MCTKIEENTLFFFGGSNGQRMFKDSFYMKIKSDSAEVNEGPEGNTERCWNSNGICHSRKNNKVYALGGFGSAAQRDELSLASGVWKLHDSNGFEEVIKQIFDGMEEKIESGKLDLPFNTCVVLHKA
jgi:hypothetical protein